MSSLVSWTGGGKRLTYFEDHKTVVISGRHNLCEVILKVTFFFIPFFKKKLRAIVGALKCSRHIPHFSRQKQERGIAIWPFQARMENISILSR